jgi:heme exporter protein A
MKLEVKSLSCVRGEKYLFRKLNFEVPPGQLLFIKGQNGSGKSTLLKILTGLASPEKGEVLWDGQNITRCAQFCSNLSYVGHKDGLKLALTPHENVVAALELGECHDASTNSSGILMQFDLAQEQHIPCQQLSAGQRRKVALAIMILKNRKLWVLDEPYTSLDKKSIDLLNRFLMQHLVNNGMVVMASHMPILDCPFQEIDLSVYTLQTKQSEWI